MNTLFRTAAIAGLFTISSAVNAADDHDHEASPTTKQVVPTTNAHDGDHDDHKKDDHDDHGHADRAKRAGEESKHSDDHKHDDHDDEHAHGEDAHADEVKLTPEAVKAS